LNENYIILSLREIIKRKEILFSVYEGKFFIRPDSGTKSFTGLIVDSENFIHEINGLLQLTSATLETLVCVASVKEIQSEYRFVICDKQVITQSEYRWDNRLDIRSDYPESCFDLAKEVALLDWQVDLAYTCDICLVNNEPKIVELNGFSSAGMYACDWMKIIPALNNAAEKSFKDIMSI